MSRDNRLKYIAGLRYKTNRYLLGTLDTRASYIPSYYDMQTLVTYSLNEKARISLFGTANINSYIYTQVEKSSFGNLAEAYQLFVYYEGSEKDQYSSYNLALTLELSPDPGFSSKFFLHGYTTDESETFDIRGTYSLNLLDKDIGSENLGDSIMNIGSGSWLDHARNKFNASILTLGYKSRWEHTDNVLSWGLKFKLENIDDSFRSGER
ncbi:MAG: hypothetical protein R2727_10605 [Bacteroidales bacterium]